MDLIAREVVQCEPYKIALIPLDERCNSLRIEAGSGEGRFEETIHVHDFIDIKPLIKAGKTMQDINDLSLLFLKLMISVTVSTKKIRIVEAKDIPFQKMIRKKEQVQKWTKTTESEEVKGLILQLKDDLFVVLPKLLIVPPQRNLQTNMKQALKQQKIKQIFYGREVGR